MVTRRKPSVYATCLLAVLLAVGFTAAPAAAVEGTGVSANGDGAAVDVGDDASLSADEDGVDAEENASVDEDEKPDPEAVTPDADPSELEYAGEQEDPVPEQACTEVDERAHENAPYEQAPWFSDLPEDAQPPGVPTDIVTPRAGGSILVGVVPGHCDVQDPNDPSYDPRQDDVDPGGDVSVARSGQHEDGGVALVYYEATLDESGDGPGVSGMAGGLATSEFGDADLEASASDGEKESGTDPRLRYWDDGTGYAENDVVVMGSGFGVESTCDGSECKPDVRGLPKFEEIPAVPAPTAQD